MLAAAAAAALFSIGCGGETSPPGPASRGEVPLAVAIDVDPRSGGPPVSPRLFGANALWIDGGVGLVRRGTGESDPATVAAVRDLGVGLIRFPGGTQAHRYHFMDGIGPLASRKPGVDVFSGREVAHDYGFDEFMRCAAEIGAEPIVCLDWAEGSPEESAAFVAYANARPEDTGRIGTDARGRDFGTAGDWARRRAENGHPEPYGVRLFEVGNETNLKRYGERVADYAAGFLRHAEAVRRVDPAARLYAPARLEPDAPGTKDAEAGLATSWNDALLRECGARVDGFAIHFYPARRGEEAGATLLLAEAARLEAGIAAVRARAAELRPAGAAPLGIAVTEYGTFFRSADAGFTSENASLRSALFQASVLLALARAEVDAACLHALLLERPDDPRLAGGVHFAMLRRLASGALERAPIALVFPEARRALAGAARLPCRVSGASFPVGERGAALGAVDAFAARDGASGELRVVLVSRASAAPIRVDLGAAGARIASARATFVLGSGLDATRVEGERPEAWREERALAPESDGRLSLTLPPHSFAVVRCALR